MTRTGEQERFSDGSHEVSGPRSSHKVTVLASTGKRAPELSSVAHEETIPEGKKKHCVTGRFSASPRLLQPLAPMSAAKAFPNCGPQQEEVSKRPVTVVIPNPTVLFESNL